MNPIASATSIAISGMAAATTKLAVSANNTANVNTDGFEPSRTTNEDQREGGVRVTISSMAQLDRAQTSSSIPPVRPGQELQPSRTDLIEETSSRILAAAAFRSNLKMMQTADDVTGALIDVVSRR